MVLLLLHPVVHSCLDSWVSLEDAWAWSLVWAMDRLSVWVNAESVAWSATATRSPIVHNLPISSKAEYTWSPSTAANGCHALGSESLTPCATGDTWYTAKAQCGTWLPLRFSCSRQSPANGDCSTLVPAATAGMKTAAQIRLCASTTGVELTHDGVEQLF